MYLSIIVPFYNVEKYISKCLDSILDQHFKDYEIICINDCSPDNSRNIVNKYAAKHKNIKLIEHKINKKVGGARNTGLIHAQGKYIWFVDSDDFIVSNSLTQLVNTCILNDLDVLAFNIKTVNNNEYEIEKENAFKNFNTTPIEGADFLYETFGNQLIFNLGYPYRAIYKKSHLINIKATFPENISYGEETTYMARCIVHAKRVMSFSDAYYCYRQNPSSITNKLEVGFKGELVFQSIINAGNYVHNLIRECETLDRNTADNLKSGMPWFTNRLLFRLLKTSQKERKIFFELCNSNQHLTLIIANYCNFYNRLILKHPKLSSIIFFIIGPVFCFKKKVLDKNKKQTK